MAVQPAHTGIKASVVGLRQRGLSYSEIQKTISVPKSTLSMWLRGVEISRSHRARLLERRRQAALEAIAKRKRNRREQMSEIRQSSLRDIRTISSRELWLMGLALYWGCGSRANSASSPGDVRFRSSNPAHISFFIKWLIDIGKIGREDIVFDLYVRERDERAVSRVVHMWSGVTGFPPRSFSRVYMLKGVASLGGRRRKTQTGLLQIRVRKSTLLRRQIDGWMNGIISSVAGGGFGYKEAGRIAGVHKK